MTAIYVALGATVFWTVAAACAATALVVAWGLYADRALALAERSDAETTYTGEHPMNKEQAFRETAEGAIEDHRATIEAVRRFIRPTEQQMTEMVIRFLAFPLPKPVITDACALCQSRANRHSRSLFSFDEAKALLEFVMPPPGEWGGLTPKQAWWAGYRVGKGLPPDMPRSEAVGASPDHQGE